MKSIEVKVAYNGITKPLELQPHMSVTAAVQQATHQFGITANAHTFAFFREDGSEIPEKSSVDEAGIKVGTVLALRPSTVKGG